MTDPSPKYIFTEVIGTTNLHKIRHLHKYFPNQGLNLQCICSEVKDLYKLDRVTWTEYLGLFCILANFLCPEIDFNPSPNDFLGRKGIGSLLYFFSSLCFQLLATTSTHLLMTIIEHKIMWNYFNFNFLLSISSFITEPWFTCKYQPAEAVLFLGCQYKRLYGRNWLRWEAGSSSIV